MIKHFHSNLFYASDLRKTVEFYRQLGFDVQKSDETIRIKLGDFTLAFIDEKKTPIQNESGLQPKGLGVFTYVEVDDVDKYFQFIKNNGINPSHEPRDWPWGKREFRTHLKNTPEPRCRRFSALHKAQRGKCILGDTLTRSNAAGAENIRNPKGYSQFQRSLCRSSLEYRGGYTCIDASRAR